MYFSDWELEQHYNAKETETVFVYKREKVFTLKKLLKKLRGKKSKTACCQIEIKEVQQENVCCKTNKKSTCCE